jgi:HlyD family secretion protein
VSHLKALVELNKMDRIIDKKTFLSLKHKLIFKALTAVVVGVIGIYLITAPKGQSLKIDVKRLVVSDVRESEYQEFLPVRGTISPKRVIYLDAIEGGRVEHIYLEEGVMLKAGDKILELSNSTLQLNVLAREADVSEQINNLRNTRLAMERSRLAKKTDLIEIEYRIKGLKRNLGKSKSLLAKNLIAQDTFAQVKDEYDYFNARRDVVKESQVKELALQAEQIEQLEINVKMLQSNLGISRKSLDNLKLVAPIAGQLTFLDAELGEFMPAGQRLGQIDVLNNFKVTTLVDEFYINRVARDQIGSYKLSGENWQLRVVKIYPGVTNGQFEVDWTFVGETPKNIHRGQTLQIRLELGDSNKTLVVDTGGFYQDSGGNWAFVVDKDGKGATKRTVSFGKRNADMLEVASGLVIGERIITSSYGNYSKMSRLTFL